MSGFLSLSREPAAIIAAVVAFLIAGIGTLPTDDATKSVLTWAIVLVGGFITRAIVSSPATVARLLSLR